MITPTSNAVPSTSPADLLFNAEKLDESINSSLLSYVDRRGVSRLTLAGAIARISAVNPRGAWTTGTLYNARDVVSNSGTWYIAVDQHTAGATFSGDQAAHWRVYQGVISSELSDNVTGTKGAALVGYDSDLAYPAGTAGAKLNAFVTPEDAQFGAVGDGVADDTAALQAFYTYLAANGGIGLLGRKTYKITNQISLTSPARGFAVYGSGPESLIQLRAASAVSAFGFVNPTGIIHQGFRIDCGYSVTGFASHGMSFRNANRCTWRDIEVFDHRNAAILTFVDADDTYGDCHIINCKADGNGNGQNGFLHEGMLRSSIQHCTVRGLSTSGSPCYGLQIKNRSKHCWISGGFVSGAIAGVALGGDGSLAGDGPYYCTVEGVITKDCNDGAVISKTTDCHVELFADMAASPSGGYALNVAGLNDDLECTIRLRGVQSGRTAIRIGSTDTTIYAPHIDGYGSTLAVIDSGVQNLDMTVGRIIGAGNTTDLGSLITNNSGNTGHLIRWLRDIPGQRIDDFSVLRLSVAGQWDNSLTYTQSTASLTTRLNGGAVHVLTAAASRPSTDNAMDCGTASFRIKQYYGVNTTISTSDEREKRDFAPIDDAVLDAWADVEFMSFRWKDSVQQKGEKARVHFGLVAQRVLTAFANRGLDPFRFGVLCYDEWPDQQEVIADDGTVLQERVRAGNRYGVRYDQALVLEAALMRRELNRLREACR